jgi:hypothetical protein
LVGNLPAGFELLTVASSPDGTVFAGGHPASRPNLGRIYRLAGGGTELVLGSATPPLGLPVGTALRPTGVVALGPAELLVADSLRGQILHVQAGKPIVALYGKPGGAELKEGADAQAAALAPNGLARDAVGRLYFLNGTRELWRIDTKGQLARLYLDPTSGDGAQLSELATVAVTPTGELLVGGLRGITGGTLTGFLVHVDPKGVAKTVAGPTTGERVCGMATDPSGAIVFGLAPEPAVGDDARALRLMRWIAEEGAKEAAAGSYREHPVGFGLLGADAKNRWYVLAGTGAGQVASIIRFDSADGTRALIAGPGAPRFASDTRDTSLLDVRGMSLLVGTAFVADGEQIKHLTGLAD